MPSAGSGESHRQLVLDQLAGPSLTRFVLVGAAMTPARPAAAATVVDLLGARAEERPDFHLYTFVLDGDESDASLSLSALDRQARAVAAHLQDAGVVGERVLLLYPPGLEYLAGFYGCLHAGAVAVPAYPPDPFRLERSMPRLQAIVADAQPKAVLTTEAVLALARPLFARFAALAALHWIATDRIAPADASTWRRPLVSGDSLAFLQYTSGSTSSPRGVMLTHRNLIDNSALIHRFFEHSIDTQCIIWLPPYHDMGLIGGILQPLFGGFAVTLLSPMAFLQRPVRWLKTITRKKGSVSGGPNFAYDLCARKVTAVEKSALDLRSWKVAFNGAEPVRAETIDRFVEAFAPCGFSREAFYPCYGLAEGTLIVPGGRVAEPPVVAEVDAVALEANRVAPAAGGRSLVGSGKSAPEQLVIIVDPTTRSRRPDGKIGEIWVAGTSVAGGYWDRPDETARTFGAFTGDTCEGPFLRTGDLGFLRDGELFVTGRMKDLLIVDGRNHYPQDLELTVETCHSALRPGCCAAFAVNGPAGERIVIVAEIQKGLTAGADEIQHAVRSAVAREHDVKLDDVVLIATGSIAKTSSGKLQRWACRNEYLAGQLARWSRP
jgi:acyl-CoA synthetase (AMP-forming)/AMP-acid ligase II